LKINVGFNCFVLLKPYSVSVLNKNRMLLLPYFQRSLCCFLQPYFSNWVAKVTVFFVFNQTFFKKFFNFFYSIETMLRAVFFSGRQRYDVNFYQQIFY
jgi:hypothetical protein